MFMQTRTTLFTQRSALIWRTIAVIFAVTFVTGLTPVPAAAASEGIREAEASAAESAESCQDASRWLEIDLGDLAPGNPTAARYLAGSAAARTWLDVAANCPSRFGEGVMKSAQLRHTSDIWAQKSGFATSPVNEAHENLNEIARLDVPDEALTQMALAEDRAGFEVGVLAARNNPDATLALSDAHKAVAERLISLAGGDGRTGADDPRRKVYNVSALLAHPYAIEDPATKLTAPTLAVIEMICARADVEALNDTTGKNGKAAPSSKPSTPGSPTTHPASPDNQSSVEDPTATVKLATLIASRAYFAMTLGYPATDAALFKQ
ncbi:hypothetical protein [Bifidobacterium bohemicum]|nr:hypothetical protein [Bifidobacterium bohemicum]